MLKILNLLGGCKSQTLQSSCCKSSGCKFFIYTHPAVNKKKIEHESRYSCKPIKDYDFER